MRRNTEELTGMQEQERKGQSQREKEGITSFWKQLLWILLSSDMKACHCHSPGGEERESKKEKGREKKTSPWDAYRWVTGDSSPLQGGFYRHGSILGADNAHTHTHASAHALQHKRFYSAHCSSFSRCDNERGNEGCVKEWGWAQWRLCWKQGKFSGCKGRCADK